MTVKCLPLGAYQTNCYFAWGDNSDACIVIDPGYAPDTVLQTAKQLGKSICAILLTHGHFDHVGGATSIAQQTGCEVYCHEGDLSLPPLFTAGAIPYTHLYAEGDRLSLAGLELKVLHTPGHTPGSVCLLCEDTLFSGDTLFMDSCGRTDLPGGSNAAILRSLSRLAALEGDFKVLPGHGSATTLANEKKYNPYLNR